MTPALDGRVMWELLEAVGHDCSSLQASRSFVAPSVVAKLRLSTEEMNARVRFHVAIGSELVVRTVVRKAKFRSGDLETWADLLVAQIPDQRILGRDRLCRESVVWDFGHCRLSARRQGKPGVASGQKPRR